MELSISLLEVGLDRKVEFGGEIEVILQHAEQSPLARSAVHSAVCHDCNTCACAMCTAHAQYIIMVKGGGCKKVMRALMRSTNSGLRALAPCTTKDTFDCQYFDRVNFDCMYLQYSTG